MFMLGACNRKVSDIKSPKPNPAGKCAEPAEEALERATGCGPGGLEEPVRRLADMLGGDNGAISAWRILHLYLQRLGCDFGLQARRAGRLGPLI
jgi:hypothetical protein